MSRAAACAALCFTTGYFAASAEADLVVYEGFDYTLGANVVGLDGGVGFDGAWTGDTGAGAGAANTNIGVGLGFGSLQVVGGSVDRQDRNGRGVINRSITAAAQTQLTADNSTIWFSVLMDPTSLVGGAGGFPVNTYGTLIFGDAAFADASSNSAPANAGNAFGVGFLGGPPASAFDAMSIQGVAYDAADGLTTAIIGDPILVGDTISFIVGKIDFAALGTTDTMTLYQVTDPGLALPETPFSTLSVDLDQSGFSLISIADPMTSIFDEIRIGMTLADVTPIAPRNGSKITPSIPIA
ncbi:hypothetical protein [Pirellulimonas nuda]|uniref:hypothetical protein n=1 Tax=Pirellulimonas nuda TaxID=2528009 RepID=UPI00119D57BB|nr:hypothetical protein [Pirellulimonas nuda]